MNIGVSILSSPPPFEPDLSNPHLARAVRLRDELAADAVARDREGGRPEAAVRLLKDSGLLSIHIPAAYGGHCAPWTDVFAVVRELAKVDGSVAHLFGYHHVPLFAIYNGSGEAQKRDLLGRTASERWLWGNARADGADAASGRDIDGKWRVDGRRYFGSGSHVADYLSIAFRTESKGKLTAFIPADRAGLSIVGDWDGIGQTQTGSGTVTFDNLVVDASEVLGFGVDTPGDKIPVATLSPQLAQLVLLNIFVGSAQGALLEASRYTRTQSRPFIHSGVTRAIDDTWIQSRYGGLAGKVLAAAALADRAGASFEASWRRGADLDLEGRGETAVVVAAANVFAGDIALEVGAAVFELTGARSATRRHGLDRFWRNVRVHTLHNPAEYKMRTVGNWLLSSAFPEYAQYR